MSRDRAEYRPRGNGRKLASAATDPSWDCSIDALTRDEAAVCGDPALAARDRLLADLYTRLRSALAAQSENDNELNDLIKAQQDWFRQRRQCREPQLVACIAGVYDQRIAFLRSSLAQR